MSQQPPPTHPRATRTFAEDDAPTVSLRATTYGPPPIMPGGGRPGGTNTMAILSLVFAVLFSPLGIVFGILGRRQTRRTGQPGRGLATVGLALSVVFLVLGVAATVYLTVLAAQVVSSAPGPVPVQVPDQPQVSEPAAPTGPVPTGPAGTATVGLTNGEYGPEVPSEALAEQVGAQSGATDVICPGYLPAQVDASTVCSGGVDGQQAQLRTLVTAVEGSEATVDITRAG
jgi:hypothetical protein